MIKINFFVKSNNWSRRINKVKKIANQVMKQKNYLNFNKNINYHLNIILINDVKMKKLNLKFKQTNKTTDVLTFVSSIEDRNFKQNKFCDIFLSAETIKLDSSINKINFYNHFTHLLIHSFLHINGYMHKKIKDFIKMQKIEIKILNKMGIKNPYLVQ
ncbi:MAG: rRNA maturation RNase YbeY [Rickettsiales bacterium]|nr:rRNA maturation RNase YbeY [Rickettsiales bacterium]